MKRGCRKVYRVVCVEVELLGASPLGLPLSNLNSQRMLSTSSRRKRVVPSTQLASRTMVKRRKSSSHACAVSLA
jgi:hypothetical protein